MKPLNLKEYAEQLIERGTVDEVRFGREILDLLDEVAFEHEVAREDDEA